ncbi:MAG: hypothetical protein ACT4QC_21100 [Planctomycetaceae bacterium]
MALFLPWQEAGDDGKKLTEPHTGRRQRMSYCHVEAPANLRFLLIINTAQPSSGQEVFLWRAVFQAVPCDAGT